MSEKTLNRIFWKFLDSLHIISCGFPIGSACYLAEKLSWRVFRKTGSLGGPSAPCSFDLAQRSQKDRKINNIKSVSWQFLLFGKIRVPWIDLLSRQVSINAARPGL